VIHTGSKIGARERQRELQRPVMAAADWNCCWCWCWCCPRPSSASHIDLCRNELAAQRRARVVTARLTGAW